jgi:hypothetical protein
MSSELEGLTTSSSLQQFVERPGKGFRRTLYPESADLLPVKLFDFATSSHSSTRRLSNYPSDIAISSTPGRLLRPTQTQVGRWLMCRPR